MQDPQGILPADSGTVDPSPAGTLPGPGTDIIETTDAAASSATTYNLGIGQTAAGSVTASDSDWYRVTLTAGQTYTFAMTGTGTTSVVDTYLQLRASNGTVVAYYPGNTTPTDQAGDVWLNADSISMTAITEGEYSFQAIMHVIGHAIGLSHPGLYNAAAGVSITYDNDAEFIQDDMQYSLMSCFWDSVGTGAVFTFDAGNSLIIRNQSVGSFPAADFHFVT